MLFSACPILCEQLNYLEYLKSCFTFVFVLVQSEKLIEFLSFVWFKLLFSFFFG